MCKVWTFNEYNLNASLNIKVAGLAVLACGVDEVHSIQNATKKQEPTELAKPKFLLGLAT
jgi:hypothetical protein